MTTPTTEIMIHAGVPRDAIDRPLGRLFVLLCERYDLDPALKQLEVITTKNGPAVYITADGYRHIALASGELDGITIPDASPGEHGWRAHVEVWRKGCSHPFDGRAGCGFTEGADRNGNPITKDDPEAIAITRATRRALRNAFDPIRVDPEFAGYLRDSEVDVDEGTGEIGQTRPLTAREVYRVDDEIAPAAAETPVGRGDDTGRDAPPSPADAGQSDPDAMGVTSGPTGRIDHARQRAAREAFNWLGADQRTSFRRAFAITDLGAPWPDAALDELLGRSGG